MLRSEPGSTLLQCVCGGGEGVWEIQLANLPLFCALNFSSASLSALGFLPVCLPDGRMEEMNGKKKREDLLDFCLVSAFSRVCSVWGGLYGSLGQECRF